MEGTDINLEKCAKCIILAGRFNIENFPFGCVKINLEVDVRADDD